MRSFATSALVVIALTLLSLSGVLAQDEGKQPPRQTILRTIKNSAELNVFQRILPISKPALDERLGDPKRLSTVFAPTNKAFENLATLINNDTSPGSTPDQIIGVLQPVLNTLDSLSEIPGVPSATDLLYYHMKKGRSGIFKLEGTTFETGARSLNLSIENGEIVDGDPSANTPIRTKNIRHVNGFLNIIEEVLIPVPASTLLFLIRNGALPPVETPSETPDMPTPSPEVTTPTSTPTAPTEIETPTAEMSETPEESSPGNGDEDDDDDNVCFPASAQVHLPNGEMVRMDKLEPGQQVLHNTDSSSKIFLFTHRDAAKRTRFVRLSTSCGQSLTLTASHYVHNSEHNLIAAGDVIIGETKVQTVKGVCEITNKETVPGVGLYAPHSVHGDLVVDGVIVSGYSKAVHPAVAHALLAPVRWYVKHFKANEPLGKTFYNGADWAVRFLPRGHAQVNFA